MVKLVIHDPRLASDFYRLVREAHDASEAVDQYDLHSESEESMKVWAELLVEQARASIDLVEFIEKNGDELAYQLGQAAAVTHFRKIGLGA